MGVRLQEMLEALPETTVVVLTGTGIKATPRIAELLGLTP